VTASIGLAARRDDESLEATMRRADMALYEAKSTGRNCAVAARCNDGDNVMVA
jgi:PleD family two-component response regulator